jgi:hypothetical protein
LEHSKDSHKKAQEAQEAQKLQENHFVPLVPFVASHLQKRLTLQMNF